ncbi:MAG: response regulator [Desulfuromonadales bacterium]|nr:response regulator [Desulfuromonadales bacterium]
MKRKIVIIDDDQYFLNFLTGYVSERYPDFKILAFNDPIKSLSAISADTDLLLIDLEMPGLDGTKLLSYALESGIDRKKIIILSGRDAEYLHKKIPMGRCLAVLNKHETRQKEVLDMVFSALQKEAEE